MAKLCVFCCCFIVLSSSPHSVWSQVKTEEQIRKSVFDTAYYYSGIVREPYKAGMNNRHWAISRFNKKLGIASNSPYCSSFGVYCWAVNGIKFSGVNGAAYSWRKSSKMLWHRGFLALDESLWPRIQVMDAVVCTWSHVEFVAPAAVNTSVVRYSRDGITTIAGNTRGGKNRGEGVYYPVYRPMSFILGVYNWFTPYYIENVKTKK